MRSNKQKQKEKIFDLIFESASQYLKLYNRGLSYNFNKEDGYSATLDKCDLTHFTATISFQNEVWQRINKEDIDDVILLTIHEMLHIFTGTGATYFRDNEDDFRLFFGKNTVTLYYNNFVAFEEQMTNILDKVIFSGFKQTKEYSKIKELILKLKD